MQTRKISHRLSWPVGIAAIVLLGACKKSTDPVVTIETAPAERRSIVLSAQANGTVEPVDIIEVKSKASGTIIRMPVDVGSNVHTGDLLVQIDPRDVQNQYDQAAADLSSATVARAVGLSQRNRSADLFKQAIITAQEMEAATLTFANADAQVIKARTNLSIARLRLQDATVRAPSNGTVIERPVSEGTVITSATSSASGGTTILRMADLTKVRMRAFVNETDIGNVLPSQTATVTVDAFPNRRFVGVVEQVEPQAVVQSSVTMFPVLVSLTNADGALKPGMNGQVVMDITRHDNVLAVPSDAIRNSRDAATVAPVLGVPADSIRAVIAAARQNRGGLNRGGTASSTASRAPGDTAGGRRLGGGGGGGGAGGPMVVFTKKDGKYTPKIIRAGISDFDYTEIVSGVQSGEQVALLGPAVLQAQREQVQARVRAGTGGGLQQQTTPAAGGAGAGAAGGARGGGGGGRPPGT